MEGRLRASDAAEVRAELAASDADSIASFADATSVAAEIGIADATVTSRPRSRRSVYGWLSVGLPIAAVLAFAALMLSRRDDQPFSARALVARLPVSVGAPGADAWPPTRGVAGEFAPSVRAARLGALFVDLELAMRRSDSSEAQRAAPSIAALGDDVPGATRLLASYRAIASGDVPPAAYPHRERSDDALARLAGAKVVAAAAAAEVIRVGAAASGPASTEGLCSMSAELRRNLSTLALANPAERDSLLQALDQRPCDAARLRRLSSAFLASLTR